MSLNLNEQVLVLNRYYFAIEITTAKEAICSLVIAKAKVIDNNYRKYDLSQWAEFTNRNESNDLIRAIYPNIISSPRLKLFIPNTIIFPECDHLPNLQDRQVQFSRKSILQRDEYTCQYCGKKPNNKQEISLDHIIPKSRGGNSSWKNLVASCIKCNARKGNRLLTELGWNLIKEPKQPRWRSCGSVIMDQKKMQIWNQFL